MRILLVGQPNCGKTTLFNRLTGRQEHTGNRAGVTVDCARAKLKGTGDELVDLPGLYSFSGGGQDESKAREAICSEDPDVILNVADSTTLVRSLTLTLQLLSFGKPMTMLLNMTDEAHKQGVFIDAEKLASILQVPVFCVSARTWEGLEDPGRILAAARASDLSVPFAPEPLFSFAQAIEKEVMIRSDPPKRKGPDHWLLHPLWGLPIFALVLGLVFLITFQYAGPWLSRGIDWMMDKVRTALSSAGVDMPVLTDGLLGSAGYVLSFLPVITILSLMLTLLEDVGYLPRAAFILDGWLKKIGLDGRCAVPLLLGFGCTVPAVMATRSLPEDRLRRSTVRLLPFVPCSARLPFMLLLGGSLFSDHPARGALLFYGLSLFAGVVYGSLSRKQDRTSAFYIELPPLRMPRWQSVLKETEKHVDHFLKRAGLILLPTAFLLWIAFHVKADLHPARTGEESLLSALGKCLLPLLRPLGLAVWRSGVLLLSGAGARETMASTAALFMADGLILTWEQAAVLGTVSLLLPPCLGTLTIVHGEFGAWETAKLVLRQCIFAWSVGCIMHCILHFLSRILL